MLLTLWKKPEYPEEITDLDRCWARVAGPCDWNVTEAVIVVTLFKPPYDKTIKTNVQRPAKTRISLGIRPG